MSPARGRSLGDRAADARRRAFVGRGAEIELFVQALEAVEPPFAVLHVHGPGGVGKSSLLARFADEARSRDVPVLALDASATAPIPTAFLAALGARSIEEAAANVCAPERGAGVLLIDTYEELGPLDDWLREALVPALPARAIVVLAGRDPPRPAWRSDPGHAALLRVRALRNLRAEESAELLRARGVAEPLCADAHALTHGHPLALALVAELLRDADSGALPALTPGVVRELLERIVRGLPDNSHREALEVAALVRVATEDLFRELGLEQAAALYRWLEGLSFARPCEDGGVALHDLVRDAVAADLAFRDPTRERDLRGRIGARNRRVLEESTGRARERAFFDALFSMRSDPSARPYYDWDRGASGGARPLRASELEDALADLERNEGAAAAAIARAWWERQPDAFSALLDPAGAYLGFIVYLHLAPAELDDARFDPAVASVAAVARSAAPRQGERIALLRFWIWRDAYQDVGSAAHIPHSMVVGLDWMFSTSLSWCVLVVQRVETWRGFFAIIGFDERPAQRFALGDRAFHVFARDFRASPWAGHPSKPAGPAPAPRKPERVVLAEPDFAAAVRDALRLASRPKELAESPLVASRLVADWAEGEPPTPEMIVELLSVAASGLKDDRDDRPRRCVELAYLKPAPTHEMAAERLGLSFSTFRRQLARGVEGVIAYLWDREIHGAGARS